MTILYYNISKGLKLPPVLKKRGRPKGHDCTTIRLPAKRLKSSKNLKVSVVNIAQKKKEVHVILNDPAMTVHTYYYSYIVVVC